MPFGDQTGPLGQGPMTGRGAGYCAGYDRPGYMNPYPYGGRGYLGWGRGRGWRNWARATGLPGWQRARMGLPAWGGQTYYPQYPVTPYQPTPYQPTPDQEKEMLTQELEGLKQEMKAIEKRLGEVKGSKKIKVEEK